MPVYLIADMHVTDASRYEEYKRLAPLAIEKYGGRYIARGSRGGLVAFPTGDPGVREPREGEGLVRFSRVSCRARGTKRHGTIPDGRHQGPLSRPGDRHPGIEKDEV